MDRRQLAPEAALPGALQKDAGVDPALLSLLLKDVVLFEGERERFVRDDLQLARSFRREWAP